jgi:hypothetical protein
MPSRLVPSSCLLVPPPRFLLPAEKYSYTKSGIHFFFIVDVRFVHFRQWYKWSRLNCMFISFPIFSFYTPTMYYAPQIIPRFQLSCPYSFSMFLL